MMSAAVPWIGMLMAIRSPAAAQRRDARLQLRDRALAAEQGRHEALLLGDLLDVEHVVADPRVGGEVAW